MLSNLLAMGILTAVKLVSKEMGICPKYLLSLLVLVLVLAHFALWFGIYNNVFQYIFIDASS